MFEKINLVLLSVSVEVQRYANTDGFRRSVIRYSHMTISSDFLGLVKEKKLVDPRLQKTVRWFGTEQAKKVKDHECIKMTNL